MAEPDNLILEHLRAIRAQVEKIDTKIDQMESRLTGRIESIELRLDGLTHAVIAGFGSLVHELDGIKDRVARLEHERA
jgi:hypothetical protein